MLRASSSGQVWESRPGTQTARFCKSTKRDRLDGYVAAQTILQYWKYGYTRRKYNVCSGDFSRKKLDLRMIPIAFENLAVILVNFPLALARS